MARLFDDGASDYLINSTRIITAWPFTMAGWGRTNDNSVIQTVAGLADVDTTNKYVALWFGAVGTAAVIRAWVINAGAGGVEANTSTQYSENIWHHLCGVYEADDIHVYLDGGGKGSLGSNGKVIPEFDNVSVGMMRDSSPDQEMSGDLAEAAVWDVALTDAEVAILAAGYSPLFVRPQSLIFYAPLIRGLNDKVGGLTLTADGTTVSAHPRIIYPAPIWTGFPGTATGGEVAPTSVIYGPLVGPMGGPI